MTTNEIKVKRDVTWGEIYKRYISGFKELKYKVKHWTVYYRPACSLANYKLQYTFDAVLIHLKDVTYAAFVCDGMFRFTGPNEDEKCIVLRIPKRIDSVEDIPEDVRTATLSELYDLEEEEIKQRVHED